MFKTIIRPVITLWEKFFAWAENIKTIEGSPHGLLRMSTQTFKGRPTILSEGTEINPGDYIIEIHISNLILYQGQINGTKIDTNIQFLRLFREEINNLARLAKEGRLDPKVKAVWGVTMLGPAMRRLGFELEPMGKGLGSWLIIKWMTFLKWLFSPNTSQSSSRSRHLGYQYWMSMEQLKSLP